MESATDQSASRDPSMGASKLRYPLRSAKPYSAVSQSVSVLDLSGKDKSAKPPRRLSIPTKTATGPRPAPIGSVTPTSQTRNVRSDGQEKSDTPASDVSRSASRRKFSTLSSVSYWLTQIKLAEASSKHSVSLGFFKLALESGCEPLDRMREELKAYVTRHDLGNELESSVKDLLQIYNILEDFEQLKVSETCSKLPKEGKPEKNNQNSATTRTGSLRPMSLNSNSPSIVDSNKGDSAHKGKPTSRIRGSYNKNTARAILVKDSNNNQMENKNPKQKGQQDCGNENNNCLPNKPIAEPVDELPKEILHEGKENMDTELMEVAGVTE
uniref:Uncharacterized protein n=1 Tax=Ananas comosus var. bracteatus TaxID=296719 RepID=A0A6V7QQD5_ANACO